MTHHDDALPDDRGPERDLAHGPDNDPLAELLAAWQDQAIPEATPELDDCDDETRAVVSWMAEAWAAQPIPAAAPQRPTRPTLRWPRRATRPQLTRRAAAALLLAGLTLALLSRPEPSTDLAPPHMVATTQPTTTGAGAPNADLAHARPEPRLVAVANDQIVFRSGPVRLVLITNHLTGE